jgi:hypothetical protein
MEVGRHQALSQVMIKNGFPLRFRFSVLLKIISSMTVSCKYKKFLFLGLFTFYSYRDPNFESTIETFEKSSQWVSRNDR